MVARHAARLINLRPQQHREAKQEEPNEWARIFAPKAHFDGDQCEHAANGAGGKIEQPRTFEPKLVILECGIPNRHRQREKRNKDHAPTMDVFRRQNKAPIIPNPLGFRDNAAKQREDSTQCYRPLLFLLLGVCR